AAARGGSAGAPPGNRRARLEHPRLGRRLGAEGPVPGRVPRLRPHRQALPALRPAGRARPPGGALDALLPAVPAARIARGLRTRIDADQTERGRQQDGIPAAYFLSFPNSRLGTLLRETPCGGARLGGGREAEFRGTAVPEREFGNEIRQRAAAFLPFLSRAALIRARSPRTQSAGNRMSYRAFKRLLGETSLERKCRF